MRYLPVLAVVMLRYVIEIVGCHRIFISLGSLRRDSSLCDSGCWSKNVIILSCLGNLTCICFCTMYICKLWSFATASAIGYVRHCRVHSSNSAIPCGVPHCKQHFRKMSTFYCHVSRCHGVVRRRAKYSFLYTADVPVKCNNGCGKVMNFTELIRHLKGHIDAGITVKCPAQGCGRLMRKKSTFTAHLSVKHGMLNKATIDKTLA